MSEFNRGDRVRFTSKSLGILDDTGLRFIEEHCGVDTDIPEGVYLAPQYSEAEIARRADAVPPRQGDRSLAEELAEWHSIEVEVNGEQRICPVHESMFEAVTPPAE